MNSHNVIATTEALVRAMGAAAKQLKRHDDFDGMIVSVQRLRCACDVWLSTADAFMFARIGAQEDEEA